ncbi:patatin domain-containing protein [Undibacterium piscinae]|uniref:Patatin domain-containing protein n=1 Tax=Undibacterium piscinae TaxID=2495591 RepID=A0A6M4A0K8_9BURK|nr:patatin domain-containing protein [Undibacterium piscinae]
MPPRHALTFLLTACFSVLSASSIAQPVANDKSEVKQRPKIALVLSGGGARGFAHIGVLRVLKDMHIPIDMVVGTSMGAVVGGAYAAGRSVEELEQLVKNTSWDSVLADRPARDDLDFRRREEDVLLPSRIEFAITKSGIALPPSAAGNAALEQALSRLLPSGTRDDPIDQLPLPFRSVVSDLVSGELIELSNTPLFQTLRASLAVPGVFAPVHINKRLVVDGGLVRNLPIDMAHKMGADIVIAVNVGTPLAQEQELGSAISVAQQMLQILTEQNVQRSLKELRPQDILISPDLTGISFLDFSEQNKTIQAGNLATRELAARLAELAISEDDYAAREKNRFAAFTAPDIALPLARLEIKGTRYINPAALIVQSGLTPGQNVSEEQVRLASSKLYGRGDLDHVETEIHDTIDQRSVTITANEAIWSRNRLRIGLELASDFSDNNQFTLSAMHIASSLNPWGGELRSIAKIGSQRQIGSQLFQPLSPGSDWYVAPSLQYGAQSQDLYDQGRKALRYGYKFTTASIALGRQLSNWGDVRFGINRQLNEARIELPDISDQTFFKAYDTTQFFNFRLDTLDSLAFPTRGNFINASWQRSPSNEAGQKSLAQSSIVAMSAFKTGEWAGHLYGEWAKSQTGMAPVALGGFLRLSGTPADSLSNNTVALGRVVLARRIGRMPTTLGGSIRAGFSAELGGGFEADDVVRFSTFKQSASAFISLDTRFGPLYFGAGATRGTGSTLYLFLGPIW